MVKVVEARTDSRLVAHEIDPKDFLSFAQKIVGGYIEHVNCGDYSMWVNEEGLLLGLDENNIGSTFSGRHIVGNVLLTGNEDENGHITNLEM